MGNVVLLIRHSFYTQPLELIGCKKNCTQKYTRNKKENKVKISPK